MSDKVKKLSEAYETLQKESADLEKVLKEKRDAHGKLSLENRDLEAQMAERAQKMFVLKNEIHETTIHLQNKQREEGQARMSMEAQIHEDKVAALTSKQPEFFDELERLYSERVMVSDSSLQGFSSLMEPSVFKEKMMVLADRGGFGGIALEIRSAKGHYDERIKGLCEKNIRGQKVSFAEREQRFAPILDLILSPSCEVIWNGG